MIYSDGRKLTLSGWLKNNNPTSFNNPLKFQKYLFLYEAYSKIDNESYDFSRLKGYKRGPVFSTVWGDYTKEKNSFNTQADKYYISHSDIINPDIAEFASFVTDIFNENELSELTHKMNIWKSKESLINNDCYQVELSESDFTDDDASLLKNLRDSFSSDIIKCSTTIEIGPKTFLFDSENYSRFTASHLDLLSDLVCKHGDDLENPVYVEIDEEGVLLVD